MRHELKVWPQYFCRVKDGSKTFEVRVNDRGFQPGDEVVLREFDPKGKTSNNDETPMSGPSYSNGAYTRSSPLEFRVGYVYPIDAERVVFSLLAADAVGGGE